MDQDNFSAAANGPTPNPALVLRSLRIVWAALLAGEVCFLFVIIAGMPNAIRASHISAQTQQSLEIFAAGFMIFAMLASFILRKAVFSKAVKTNGELTVQAYFTGTLLFLAMCEGATFFGLMAVWLTHLWWPTALVPAAGMALQIIHFPTGAPLRSQLSSAGDLPQ